ncbi:helix-turn-helix domain-containing protein [Streptomyces sp. NPDC057654]|uniref:helix-turn-helix domain-containing protein n=1 Tax=Streptomyces sp. NPDC057654 TaxID=3346196 RepID=UPI003689B661
MALRTTTTERQRRLGAELRKLREQAGLTVSDGGASIGMGRVHLTHVERGHTAISTDRLRALCGTYGCTSSTYIDALVSLSEAKGKGWWSSYKGRLSPASLDLAELEASADELRSYESLFIPGLFQTEAYARSIFQASDTVTTPEAVETAVRFRIQRQSVVTRENPPAIHAVLHEAALHVRFGGTEVMRKQLLHLVALADLPNVTIQVLPFTSAAVSAINTPFCLLTSHTGALETVQMDHPAQAVYLHTPDATSRYRRQFELLRSTALPPVDASLTPAKHESRDSLGLVQYVLYTL